ncbi:MAG: methyltransferase domain-containing protein [Candidatus Omnitrophica bacterium]|nr:methyltransferase domain-containing protein [Candidatus Omnitrophota bacterium]
MDKQCVRNYFNKNAEEWIKSGYDEDKYSYPVAFHRARIVSSVLAEKGPNLNILDLGCGGGNLSILLAKNGHNVVGVDQSSKMIDIANESRGNLPKEEQYRVRFVLSDLEKIDLQENHFDAVTAMGLIGYLPNDDILFRLADDLLRPEGTFLVSCRNRLFNMVSLSYRTVKEIEQGEAVPLLYEIDELYQGIPKQEIEDFLDCLKESVQGIEVEALSDSFGEESASIRLGKDDNALEARQHTPKRLTEKAAEFGFKNTHCFGVHPHLMDPRVNRLLPPDVYNRISCSLEPLEQLPVSLVWSSVFLSVFEK